LLKTENLLTLHHRIPQHGLTPEENSIRMLESFWPSNPYNSHVLILSPQVELSPLFYHYLKYVVLAYKYSATKAMWQHNILSVSLDLPSTYLNDSTAFTPPAMNEKQTTTPFLWESPNSNAALYFGDKWVELHSLISGILSSQHSLPKPETLYLKEVSQTYPSWLEHILKLARARGYWTIYPNFETKDSLATIHNDLFQLPEEHLKEKEKVPDTNELTADPAKHLSLKHTEMPLIKTPLVNILPFKGELPQILDMPLLTWDGKLVQMNYILEAAAQYSNLFRKEIGGCENAELQKPIAEMDTGDLFCLDDVVGK